MKSQCIEKIKHAECGSRDGLQVFESDEGYTGYCFACDTYIPDPYDGGKPKKKWKPSKQDIADEMEAISQCESLELPDRKLKDWALEQFGIKIGVSEQDGETPVFHYYPYTKDGEVVAYKTRLIEGKKMWTVGDMKGVELFGWQQAAGISAPTLFICEGELDAASVFQALKDKSRGTKWADYDPSVVSLPRGAGNAKQSIKDNLPAIRTLFNKVVLVFDHDKAGDEAVEEVMQLLPSATRAHFSEKDANAMLMAGYSQALAKACQWNSSKPDNTKLVWAEELEEVARQQAVMGLSWPWEKLTELTRGIRLGETIYFGGGVKMGKTVTVSAIAKHMIIEHGMKVFFAQPEESNRKSYQLVAGQVAHRIFHDPKIEFDYDAYDKARPLIRRNLVLLDLYQHVGWTTLRNQIMNAVAEGCQAIFIDPITNLTNGMDSGVANILLQEVAQELAAMSKDLNIVIFIFCHLKAPEGLPHERGGKVFSSQFAGSRAMMRSCNLMIGIEGNKDPERPEGGGLKKKMRPATDEELNTRRLVILEDREFGSSGYVNLFYHTKTGIFTEIKEV
jgi:twinkle protein